MLFSSMSLSGQHQFTTASEGTAHQQKQLVEVANSQEKMENRFVDRKINS